jgi:cation transport regulator ChaB
MPVDGEELPGTLRRSPAKVRRTYEKTLASAHESYDSEERAHRAAWAAVKHVAEKVGDHWEEKDEYGPSDAQAAQGGRAAREHPEPTHGGVDVRGNSKADLYARARRLDVPGRSSMNKDELARAIARAERRESR